MLVEIDLVKGTHRSFAAGHDVDIVVIKEVNTAEMGIVVGGLLRQYQEDIRIHFDYSRGGHYTIMTVEMNGVEHQSGDFAPDLARAAIAFGRWEGVLSQNGRKKK